MCVGSRLEFEISAGNAINGLIQFDEIDLGIRKHVLQRGRDGPTTLANDQYPFRVGIEIQPAQHHLRIIEDQLLRLMQQMAGFRPNGRGQRKSMQRSSPSCVTKILRYKERSWCSNCWARAGKIPSKQAQKAAVTARNRTTESDFPVIRQCTHTAQSYGNRDCDHQDRVHFEQQHQSKRP